MPADGHSGRLDHPGEHRPGARRSPSVIHFDLCRQPLDQRCHPRFCCRYSHHRFTNRVVRSTRGVFASSEHDWEQFVKILGHPLIWLFFGGFVLAAGMSKTSLDYTLANKLILRKETTPVSLVISVLGTTFLLSMFISEHRHDCDGAGDAATDLVTKTYR
ncbi:MAG: SLC13 family permease [Planctomycetaceae bacterium]